MINEVVVELSDDNAARKFSASVAERCLRRTRIGGNRTLLNLNLRELSGSTAQRQEHAIIPFKVPIKMLQEAGGIFEKVEKTQSSAAHKSVIKRTTDFKQTSKSSVVSDATRAQELQLKCLQVPERNHQNRRKHRANEELKGQPREDPIPHTHF